MYKIKTFSKIILADHIFLVWFQHMLSIGVINMHINIAVELCQNANAINQEIRFHLFPFAFASRLLCFLVAPNGSSCCCQIKKCHAEPLHNHNTMNDRLLACVALRYYSPTWTANQWAWRSGGAGRRWRVGSMPMLVFLNDVCHQSWMPVSVPASYPLYWRVSLIKQELHEDREQRSSEWSFCYNISAVCAKKNHSLLIDVKCIATCAPAWENHTRFKNSSTLRRTERFTWRR